MAVSPSFDSACSASSAQDDSKFGAALRMTVGLLCAMVLCGGIAMAADSDARPAQLDLLDKLVGTWHSSGAFVDSAYSKAGSATATTTCAWSRDRYFLLCQQTVLMNAKPDHGLAIYTYDDATSAYKFYNLDVSRMGSTALTVDATSITYNGSFDDGSKHVLTRTTNVWDSPHGYAWRAEYSLDGGKTWVLMGSGKTLLAVDG